MMGVTIPNGGNIVNGIIELHKTTTWFKFAVAKWRSGSSKALLRDVNSSEVDEWRLSGDEALSTPPPPTPNRKSCRLLLPIAKLQRK